MNIIELRKRSHLVVRLIPESISSGMSPVYDFVELCGSDMAANPSVTKTGQMASERERIFATKSFNSLSQALLASAFKSSFKFENHS